MGTNLFVITDHTTNQVWVFSKHEDALKLKRTRPLNNKVDLHGVSLDAGKCNE